MSDESIERYLPLGTEQAYDECILPTQCTLCPLERYAIVISSKGKCEALSSNRLHSFPLALKLNEDPSSSGTKRREKRDRKLPSTPAIDRRLDKKETLQGLLVDKDDRHV